MYYINQITEHIYSFMYKSLKHIFLLSFQLIFYFANGTVISAS